MRITKVDSTFYLHLRRGGVCRRINCHASNRKQAERNARLIVAEFDKEKSGRKLAAQILQYATDLARGAVNRKHVHGPLQAMQRMAELEALDVISGFFESAKVDPAQVWDEYVATASVKSVTIDGKRAKFDRFVKWLANRDIATLRPADANDFLDSLKCSPQTRNNYISDMATIWRASADIPQIWCSDLRRKVSERRESKAADIDALRRLLTYCAANADTVISGATCEEWAQFVRALYYSGLRPVDVCMLTWSELQDGHIELMPQKTSRTRRKISFVPDRKFFLSLPTNALPVPSAHVFGTFAQMYTRYRQAVADGFRTLCRHADVPGLTLYQLRHNFVTSQINAGMAVEDVAAAVGHSATSTTETHYYHGRHDVRLAEMPEI